MGQNYPKWSENEGFCDLIVGQAQGLWLDLGSWMVFFFFFLFYLLPNFEGRVVGSQASWEGSERKMFPSTLGRAWPGVFWSLGMCDRILELMPRSQCLCSYLEATATGVFKCFPGRHREDCGQGLPDP